MKKLLLAKAAVVASTTPSMHGAERYRSCYLAGHDPMRPCSGGEKCLIFGAYRVFGVGEQKVRQSKRSSI
jgi:hypothetical protein